MQDDSEKRWDDSLLSLGLGALVVVVSGILIYNYFSYQTPNILQKTQTIAITSSPSAQDLTALSQSSPGVSPPVHQTKNEPASVTPSPVDSSTQQGFLALPTTYTIVSGDSLWKIAEKFYGSGYEWRRIAEANRLTGSSTLAVGAQITIPRAELISAAATIRTPSPVATHSPVVADSALTQHQTPVHNVRPISSPQAVAGAHSTNLSSETIPQSVPSPSAIGQSFRVDGATITYTVKRGDSLWSIAASTCGDPLLWSSIARQNNLARPSVIHAGNVFTYSCSP